LIRIRFFEKNNVQVVFSLSFFGNVRSSGEGQIQKKKQLGRERSATGRCLSQRHLPRRALLLQPKELFHYNNFRSICLKQNEQLTLDNAETEGRDKETRARRSFRHVPSKPVQSTELVKRKWKSVTEDLR
jgi:hypothetical protein